MPSGNQKYGCKTESEFLNLLLDGGTLPERRGTQLLTSTQIRFEAEKMDVALLKKYGKRAQAKAPIIRALISTN